MRHRPTHVFILAVALLALIAPSAQAASSQEIITDAITDGYIDGTYTLAQLRAADRAVSPAEREYYGWDDAYADAVRRLAAPSGGDTKAAAIVVVPIDSNRNGTIDPDETARATAKAAALKKAAGKNSAPVSAEARDSDNVSKDDIAAELAADDGDDGDDDGTPWFAWLLLIVPIVIIGFGIWRMQQTKGFTPPTRDMDPSDDDEMSAGSSFTTGPDDE